MNNDALGNVTLPAQQSEKAIDNVSNLDDLLEKSGEHIGDYTVKTRNFKIAAAIAEYKSRTPSAKF
jgi:hypothetical protein